MRRKLYNGYLTTIKVLNCNYFYKLKINKLQAFEVIRGTHILTLSRTTLLRANAD